MKVEDGDDEEGEEEDTSEDEGGVSTKGAMRIPVGVGVASLVGGKAAKPLLWTVAASSTLAFSLTPDARRAGFFCDFCDRDDGAYL